MHIVSCRRLAPTDGTKPMSPLVNYRLSGRFVLALCAAVAAAGGVSNIHAVPKAAPAKPAPAQTTPSDALLQSDPLGFLEECRAQAARPEVTGYRFLMGKRERLGGRLLPADEARVLVRSRPY